MDYKSAWKGKTASFCKESVKFEKKKLILPTLMTLLLLSSLIYGFHLRDRQEVDQRIAHSNRDLMTSFAVNSIKESYYPNKSGIENQTQLEKLNSEISERADQRAEKLFGPEKGILLLPAGLATESIVYPLAPETLIGPHNFELSNPFFTVEKGYVASKEIPSTVAEVFYRQKRLSDLDRRINNSNLSYSNFQSRIEDIRSSTYKDEKVREKAFSKEIGSPQADPGPAAGFFSMPYVGSESAADKIIQNIEDNDLKEMGLIHFIPTIFASFAMYYLLSGVVLTGLRDFRADIEEFSSNENFFRNNLLISVAITSLLTILPVLMQAEYMAHHSFLPVTLAQFFASVVFWTILFAAIVNEQRKITRYAWILTGIGLNLLMLPISSYIGYNNQLLWNTFIVGATPIYPLLLGIFSEYGRIHSEKFLREKLSN